MLKMVIEIAKRRRAVMTLLVRFGGALSTLVRVGVAMTSHRFLRRGAELVHVTTGFELQVLRPQLPGPVPPLQVHVERARDVVSETDLDVEAAPAALPAAAVDPAEVLLAVRGRGLWPAPAGSASG